MMLEQRMNDQPDRRVSAAAQAYTRQAACRGERGKATFDAGNNTLGLIGMTVGHQPTRTFRNPESHQENQTGKTRANKEGQPPAKVRVDEMWVQQYQ